MDRIPRLLAAARGGGVAALQQLLNEDPQILQRVTSSTICTETPLEKNPEGLIPLYIASASGHIDIVTELLTLDSGRDQCLVKGQGGRIPLHDAIIKGRVSVIEHLISHRAESLEEVTEKSETVFHLASKNNQSEALQLVTERMKQRQNFMTIFNAKDKGGNTFWKLGQTRENNQSDEEGQKLNAILLVAALIITVTYQGLLTPPPSVWKEDIRSINNNLLMFMLLNTYAFVSAVHLIMMEALKRQFILLQAAIFPLLANYVLLLAALFPDDYPSIYVPLVVLVQFCILMINLFTISIMGPLTIIQMTIFRR